VPSEEGGSSAGRGGAGRVNVGRVSAFAPGRVNLIGEHTDYNQGLALPFAIAEGITVRARTSGDARVYARAADQSEEDEFLLAAPERTAGWRAFVRGMVAELRGAGFPLVGARLEIHGEVPQGSGLSSSAALEVALGLALLGTIGVEVEQSEPDRAGGGPAAEPLRARGSASPAGVARLALAQLCSRVENEWVGAQSGLLDQIASLCGASHTALRIDFQTLTVEPVPLRLTGGWRLVTLDSGERHANAASGYNERRAQCAQACGLLGVDSLREATADAVEGLPEPLRRRARHVLGENARVATAVAALHARDWPAVGALLNASHASLRDDYEVSTPAAEATVERLLAAGAAGARIMGGGFGGHVLGLLGPGVEAPPAAREVRAGPGAHLLA
jgi:galactokinase